MAERTVTCARCGDLFVQWSRGRPALVCLACGSRCAVDGCDRPVRTAGFCNTHYERQRRGAEVSAPVQRRERGERLCKVSGCGQRRGRSAIYCTMHLNRVLRLGEPGSPERHAAPWGQAVWDTPAERRRVARLWKFGLTPQAFDELLAAQGGRCAICRTDDPRGNRVKTWSVDHDHACCPGPMSCGKCVRGLLCNRCNRAIGLLRDDPAVIESAAAYLRRYSEARTVSA